MTEIQNHKPVSVIENAPASAFPVACCGVSERTTIKWYKYLTFRRFPAACRSEAEIPLLRGCRELQYWNLRFICNLVLGIWDLSFGLPPFGRVPGFGMRIADFRIRIMLYAPCSMPSQIRNLQSTI